jgi:hypothetical protein
MIVQIKVTIMPSGHFSFPLLAEGTLQLPTGPLPILEMGRSREEVFERVIGFAKFHASHANN